MQEHCCIMSCRWSDAAVAPIILFIREKQRELGGGEGVRQRIHSGWTRASRGPPVCAGRKQDERNGQEQRGGVKRGRESWSGGCQGEMKRHESAVCCICLTSYLASGSADRGGATSTVVQFTEITHFQLNVALEKTNSKTNLLQA